MSKMILVVEDEVEIRDLISLHILRMGYQVKQASSAEEAFLFLKTDRFDLVVLDWMLPQMSGLDLVQAMRSEGSKTPILMLTAKAESQDIVLGLEQGADDYLTKPFEPQVLIARMNALLRRSEAVAQKQSAILKVQQLEINTDTYEVKCAGEKLHLTPSEFKLLTIMAQNVGKVLTRDSLIEQIQGEGINVVGRTVDTHVFGLRKKLGPCQDVIETIRGIGYRVIAAGGSQLR